MVILRGFVGGASGLVFLGFKRSSFTALLDKFGGNLSLGVSVFSSVKFYVWHKITSEIPSKLKILSSELELIVP